MTKNEFENLMRVRLEAALTKFENTQMTDAADENLKYAVGMALEEIFREFPQYEKFFPKSVELKVTLSDDDEYENTLCQCASCVQKEFDD